MGPLPIDSGLLTAQGCAACDLAGLPPEASLLSCACFNRNPAGSTRRLSQMRAARSLLNGESARRWAS